MRVASLYWKHVRFFCFANPVTNKIRGGKGKVSAPYEAL
ncbi:hypothetical protein THICB1_50092 [Thiomonas arsenitoxydans]|uniref:Biopterin-dependent aromatic amino acid hydroxylase family profile domain-containing protein n=1 Tax=Thiomonas arsenitoxydans (strain DSM 22701 / CIP 110005 / 3As) TaxID=426114 RepID=A0ABM9T8I5_THIA3|nr:hypothetical protein THICB1_50092 [Thiomonas arsenitoxydans]